MTPIVLGLVLWATNGRADYLQDARERTQAKIGHLERTVALLQRLEKDGPHDLAGNLGKEDLEALLYSKDPALGEAVLSYCKLRFGDDLRGHSADPDAFSGAMQYLEAIRYRPCAEPFARAVGKMQWEPDQGAILPVCSVLKSIIFWGEWEDPRAAILSQLVRDYEEDVYYLDGPAYALEAMGDESTVLALIDIMERIQDKGLRYRKSSVLTVIAEMMKPSYSKALARLAEVIRGASDENAPYAMEIAEPFASSDVDDALVATAANKQAPIGVRGEAVRTIGERKIARARDLIEEIGREEHLHQAVAQALKHIGGQSSLPLLASYLEDPEMVRIYAAESIGVITGKPFGPDAQGVAAALEWWKEHSQGSEQPDRTRLQ
jgi:hypothetical protein